MVVWEYECPEGEGSMEMHGNRKAIGYQFPTASLVWGHVGTWGSLECMCREQAKTRVTVSFDICTAMSRIPALQILFCRG